MSHDEEKTPARANKRRAPRAASAFKISYRTPGGSWTRTTTRNVSEVGAYLEGEGPPDGVQIELKVRQVGAPEKATVIRQGIDPSDVFPQLPRGFAVSLDRPSSEWKAFVRSLRAKLDRRTRSTELTVPKIEGGD